ncbi:MAG: hypothetical protein COB51_14335 [Moraxellaceae bacterium]|nr:MAG: hypothetical protein COB51_14335 [Moraxellaceae bacterium]
MKHEIQAAVEQQLMVAGSYSPLEWLIDSGAVQYPDYVAWRNGAKDGTLNGCLEDLVCLSEADLLELLNHGAWYAGELGLESEPVVFKGWHSENSQRVLLTSRNETLAVLLQQHWRRPQLEVQQFDLFMDNPGLVLENDLLELLVARRWGEAQKKLDQLYQSDPGNIKLGDFDDLIAYGLHCETPLLRGSLAGGLSSDSPTDSIANDRSMIEEELVGLETEVLPLSARVLAQSARDYLAPAWARLGHALEGLEFLPGQPKLHASYAWQQYQDWSRVQSAVERGEGSLEQPVLVWRLALSYFYQQKRGPGLGLLCLLLSRDENFAVQSFEHCPDSRFLSIWQRFQELEVELPLSDFPGWLLLHERGAVHQLKDFSLPGAGLVYNSVFSLLVANAAGDEVDELACRKQLQACSPALLKVYLQDK